MPGKLISILKKHGGRIIYCAGVIGAVAAAAVAAEALTAGEPELVVPETDPAQLVQAVKERMAEPLPEGMRLLRDFSRLPEWNADLGQWEAHEACDYALEGDKVACLREGVLRTLGKSGVYGGFVELDCGGMIFRYASIAPADGLETGQRIGAGELLGIADDSMPGEYSMGAHLHLEVLEDGKAKDFEELLRKTHA